MFVKLSSTKYDNEMTFKKNKNDRMKWKKTSDILNDKPNRIDKLWDRIKIGLRHDMIGYM